MRPVLLLVGALCLLMAPGAEAAKRRPPCKRTPTITRCLKQTRGRAVVATTAKGVVPRAAALQAFVATVGPLPGVARVPAATGSITSGTGPIRWLRGYWPQLTPAQRKAFTAAIAPPAEARAASAAPLSIKLAWQNMVTDAAQRLAGHFGVSLKASVTTTLSPDPAENPKVLAEAVPEGDQCPITVYPGAWQSAGPDDQAMTAAHEVAHCFQYQFGTSQWFKPTRMWMVEGGAEWAGDVVAAEMLGHDPSGVEATKWWDNWLTTPQQGLFKRAYDAVGFWAHLEQTGGDAWARLRAAGGNANGALIYDKTVPASAGAFLDTLGTGYFRLPALGEGFDFTGPAITGAKPSIATITVGKTTAKTLALQPRSALPRVIDPKADILQITPGAGVRGRLRSSAGSTVDARDEATWCARDGGCSCPDGSPGDSKVGALPDLAPGDMRAGWTTRGQATTVTVRGRSLSSYCAKPAGKPAKPNGSSGGGGSLGSKSSQTSISVSGSGSVVIDQDGACSAKTDDANYMNIVFTKIVGDRVNQLTFKLKGPAPFTTPDEVRTITFDPGGSDPNEYVPYSTDTGTTDAQGYEVYKGSYELEFHKVPGGYAGSVSGTLRPPNSDSPEVSVNGSWRCRAS